MDQCPPRNRHNTTALPPRTAAPQVRREGNALIVGHPGDWRIADERDIAAEIIDEYATPAEAAAYRQARQHGQSYNPLDIALMIATAQGLRAGAGR